MDSTKEVLKMRRWVSAAAYERSIAARAGMTGKEEIAYDRVKASMLTAKKLSPYVILFLSFFVIVLGILSMFLLLWGYLSKF